MKGSFSFFLPLSIKFHDFPPFDYTINLDLSVIYSFIFLVYIS